MNINQLKELIQSYTNDYYYLRIKNEMISSDTGIVSSPYFWTNSD